MSQHSSAAPGLEWATDRAPGWKTPELGALGGSYAEVVAQCTRLAQLWSKILGDPKPIDLQIGDFPCGSYAEEATPAQNPGNGPTRTITQRVICLPSWDPAMVLVMEHELSHAAFDSDPNAMEAAVAQAVQVVTGLLPPSQVSVAQELLADLRMAYNMLEDARVISLWEVIYAGGGSLLRERWGNMVEHAAPITQAQSLGGLLYIAAKGPQHLPVGVSPQQKALYRYCEQAVARVFRTSQAGTDVAFLDWVRSVCLELRKNAPPPPQPKAGGTKAGGSAAGAGKGNQPAPSPAPVSAGGTPPATPPAAGGQGAPPAPALPAPPTPEQAAKNLTTGLRGLRSTGTAPITGGGDMLLPTPAKQKPPSRGSGFFSVASTLCAGVWGKEAHQRPTPVPPRPVPVLLDPAAASAATQGVSPLQITLDAGAHEMAKRIAELEAKLRQEAGESQPQAALEEHIAESIVEWATTSPEYAGAFKAHLGTIKIPLPAPKQTGALRRELQRLKARKKMLPHREEGDLAVDEVLHGMVSEEWDRPFFRKQARSIGGHLLLLCDISGSMSAWFSVVAQAVADIQEAADRVVKLQVHVWSFSTHLWVFPRACHPNQPCATTGSTALAASLLAAGEWAKRVRGMRRVLVLTDGDPTDRLPASPTGSAVGDLAWTVKKLRAEQAHLTWLLVGSRAADVHNPGDAVVHLTRPQDLTKALTDVAREVARR